MPTLDITLKNRLAEIVRAKDRIAEFASDNHVATAFARKLDIVLDELLSNIIRNAYTDDAEHDIGVRAELSGDRLQLRISDDGIPFDPLAVEPPDIRSPLEERGVGGLGLVLVRAIMDEVSYQRTQNGNVLTLGAKIGGESERARQKGSDE